MKRIATCLALAVLCGSGCAFNMTLERSKPIGASAEKQQLETLQQNMQKFSVEIQQAPDDAAINAILSKYGMRNGKKE
jgi:hypothetical protein